MAATLAIRNLLLGHPRLLQSFSWTGVAAFLLFAAALAAWSWSGVLLTTKTMSFEEHADYLLYLMQRNLLVYFPAYLLVAIADGLALRDTRRRLALAGALALGVFIAVQLRCAVKPHETFYVYGSIVSTFCTSFPTWRTYIDFPAAWISPLTIGAMVMVLVFGRRRNAELLAALHKARGAQIESRRQRIESDIDAMRSRVDPDALFEKLRAIRVRYEASLDEGEAKLEELIEELRQAARHPAARQAT